jgi:DNA-binding beta-propeller fold protein YncE
MQCKWVHVFTRRALNIALGVAIAAAMLALPAGAQSFHRLESVTMLKSANPDWDYITLDANRGLLFIGRRGDGVGVFDVKARKLVRTLDKTDDANSIALVPEFDRGYTANGDGTSTVFRLSTLKTVDRIKLGEDIDSAFYDPVTKQIAFTMGDSKTVAFVDAKTGTVVGKLPMESKKLDGTVPDGQGNLFMALRDRNQVVKIDIAVRKVVSEWATAPCEQPTGIAYDSGHKRIFVGCRGKAPVLAVIDADSGKVVTTLEIGRGNDGVVYDGTTKKIYTSNGVDANLVIYDQVDPDNYKLAEATTTRPYARTMAVDPKTKKIYLVTAEGTTDPSKKINKGVASFYPNRYFPDTFMVLTYKPVVLPAAKETE